MTRRAMRVYLAQAGAPQDESADVILALDEACANVIRHAFPGGCGRIRLRADVVDGRADLRVEDDGVGFDAGAIELGSGTQNMRDRVAAIGGSLDVRSSPGEGTTVVGLVPAWLDSTVPAGRSGLEEMPA